MELPKELNKWRENQVKRSIESFQLRNITEEYKGLMKMLDTNQDTVDL